MGAGPAVFLWRLLGSGGLPKWSRFGPPFAAHVPLERQSASQPSGNCMVTLVPFWSRFRWPCTTGAPASQLAKRRLCPRGREGAEPCRLWVRGVICPDKCPDITRSRGGRLQAARHQGCANLGGRMQVACRKWPAAGWAWAEPWSLGGLMPRGSQGSQLACTTLWHWHCVQAAGGRGRLPKQMSGHSPPAAGGGLQLASCGRKRPNVRTNVQTSLSPEAGGGL